MFDQQSQPYLVIGHLSATETEICSGLIVIKGFVLCLLLTYTEDEWEIKLSYQS